jgi:hypothetical protein
MKITRQLARRFRLLKLLRGSLGAGGLYNLGLAAGLLVAPEALGGGPGPALPETELLAWLTGLLLTMLGILYFLAARDPRRYSGIILVAICSRVAGAVLFGTWAAARPELSSPWLLATAEGVLGATHGGCWIPLRV